VATLAGVPKPVILRARERLRELEQIAQHHAAGQQAQMPLFDANPPAPSAADKLLTEIDPNELTPREALDLLYRLKARLGET
jgi:DNA mismatch repair protein MutS